VDDHPYDPGNAEYINELCAGCHGEFGQGGGDGEYPRLAGLPAEYLAKELRAFKSGARHSMAMAIYATDRELPEQDLLDISIYHSELALPTKMPEVPEDMDAYQRLLIAKRVVNVPRYDSGDAARGKDIYGRMCRKCHGPDGRGRGSTPQLAGQYTEYLRLQIERFRSGERTSEKMASHLQPLTGDDIESLLAFLSIADD